LVDALEAMRKEMRGELDQRLAPLERENAQLRTELVAAQRAAADVARQLDEQNTELAARRRQVSELAARQVDGEAWRQESAARFLTLERKLADSQANVSSLTEATAEAFAAASSRSGSGVSRSEFEESKRMADSAARAAASEAVAELRSSLEASAAAAAVAAPTESPTSSMNTAMSEVNEAVNALRQRLDGAESAAARALGCAEDAAAGGRAELGALRSRVDAVTDR
jgi:chromosome segregation ATPase